MRRRKPNPQGPGWLQGHVMPEWTEMATCAELPPEDLIIFYPESQAAADAARAICNVCPVRRPCAAYGDLISPAFGVFGGMTPTERKRRRDALKRVAA
jgi:WhiB family redox-sensing transcriptional regulator